MEILKIFMTIVFLSFFIGESHSQSWKLNTSNQFEIRSYSLFENENSENNIFEYKGHHDLNLRYKTGFKANISFRSIWNSTNENRSRLFLNESNIALHKGMFNFKIGKQIIKWGSLAGISNLDLANRFDYFDFIDSDKEELGQWALVNKIGNASTQFQFRLVPKSSTSRIYLQNNNWSRLPNQIVSNDQLGNIIPVAFRDLLMDDFGENTTTFDLSLKTEINDFSLGINYFNGINDLDLRQLVFDLSSSASPIIYDIQLTNSDLEIYNFSVQRLVGEWNIWSELGFIKNKMTDNENKMIDDNYWSFTLGIDRAIFFEDPAKMLKLVAQWKHSLWSKDVEYAATQIDHILDKCFLFDIEYQMSYRWQINLTTVLSYQSLGAYIKPSISWNNDRIGVAGSIDILQGSQGHFFGYYSDNSRFTFKFHCNI